MPIETLKTALADSLYQISELATTSTGEQKSIPSDEVPERNKELISSYLKAVDQLVHLLHQYLHPVFKSSLWV